MILIVSEGKKFKILKKGTWSPPGRSWGLVQKPVSLLFHGAPQGGSEFLSQAPSPLLSSNGEVPGDDVQMNWPNAKEPVGFMLLILISTHSRASLEITSPWSNLCPNTSWSLTFRQFFCMTRNLVPPWHGSSAGRQREAPHIRWSWYFSCSQCPPSTRSWFFSFRYFCPLTYRGSGLYAAIAQTGQHGGHHTEDAGLTSFQLH